MGGIRPSCGPERYRDILLAAQDMKFLLSLVVLAITLSVEVPAAFCDDQIEWEVKQPFRFFKYRSDFEIHRWALEFLKAQNSNVEPSILDMEHVLSDPAWWSKPLPISITKRFHKASTTTWIATVRSFGVDVTSGSECCACAEKLGILGPRQAP